MNAMLMKSYRILPAVLSLMLIPSLMTAQNSKLNPTVQVTNDYNNSLKEIDKAVKPVYVPDSLYKFDLNFDYSGFENPYKGNDDFNPFLTELDLQKRAFQSKRFYLKAGAGYTLRPELEAVWTFNPDSRFKVSTYASHRSYFGTYNRVALYGNMLGRDGKESWTGYDSKSKGGFVGRGDWDALSMIVDVRYDGVHAKDGWIYNATRGYNAISGALGFFSHDVSDWDYKAKVRYRYAWDKLDSLRSAQPRPVEQSIAVDGGLGYSFNASRVGLDLNVESRLGADRMNHSYTGVAGTVTPSYHFSRNRLSVGIGLSVLFTAGNGFDSGKHKVDFWPSVKLQWEAVKGHLDLYLDADSKAAPYAIGDQAASDMFYLYDDALSVVKNYVIDGGLRGNFFEKLSYDVQFGYERNENLPVYLLSAREGSSALPCLFPSVTHRNLDDAFGSFRINGNYTSWEFTIGAKYRYFINSADKLITPPSLSADAKLCYNILDRISIWAGADYVSKYRSCDYVVPEYVDLSAGARFRFTGKMSFFLEGHNLLNQLIQVVPMFARKGISGTAGIIVNF